MQINFLRGTPADQAIAPVADLFSQEFPKVFQTFGNSILQYQTPGLSDFLGFNPLKETLAKRFGITADPLKHLICTNGGMETISFLLKSLPQKSQVAIDALTYDRVLVDITQLGHSPVGVPFSKDGADLDALDETLSKGHIKLFYQVAYHHNPTGITTSLQNLETAAEICARHNVLHVLDIAYFELRYDGQHNQFINWSKFSETTVLLGSFTKTLSPGTKCGFGIFPEKIIKQLMPVITNSRLNPNYPTQAVIHNLINSGKYDQHLNFLIKLYQPRMESVNSAIRQHLPDSAVPELTGGFFFGIWLPGIYDESAFVQKANSKGVTIASPNVFAPTWKEHYTKKHNGIFFRLTFPANTPEENEQGIVAIAETYNELSKRSQA